MRRRLECVAAAAGWLWLASMCLAACATPAPPVTAANACPVPKTYSSALERQAEAAYNALPADSPLRGMIDDYGTERKELRACASTK